MSVRIMSKVWDLSMSVKEDRLIVLLALADWANDDGECWPKIGAIADKARVTPRGAKKILAWLEEEGYLTIKRGVGRGNMSRYFIHPIPVKGERKTPFSGAGKVNTETPFGDLKGEQGSPFNGAEKVNENTIKGEPRDIEKVNENTIKGERENNGTIRNARVNHQEPSVQPPMNRQCTRTQEISPKEFFEKPIEKFSDIAEEVFAATDPKSRHRYQMGNLFRDQKTEYEQIVGTLAFEGYTADDVKRFREIWPDYIKAITGKTQSDLPTRKQFFEKFDRVLNWQPSAGKTEMSQEQQLAAMAEYREQQAKAGVA